MSKNYALKSESRDRVGKGIARALRRENKVPGVIYGDGKEPVTITLPEKEVMLEYQKGQMFTTLCDMDVGGTKHLVLARDIQLHPVKDTVLHIDFLRVTPKTKIAVMVPVQLINEDKCPGLLAKGNLNVVRYEVELLCSATHIPDSIELDLEPFDIGDTIKMSDAVLPEGTETAISDRDFNIALINAPRSMEEEEVSEEGEEGAEGAAEGGEEGAEGATEGGEEKAEGGDA